MSQRDDRAEFALAVMQLIDQGHRHISRRLNLVRVQVLGAVAANEPVRPATIAAELDLTASATSRHLTALEQAELITVTPDPDDARTFLVRQTERGRAEMDATIQAGTTVFTEVIADWPDADIATAVKLISRLNHAWARCHAAASNAPRPGTGPRWRQARRPDTIGQEKE
jgi:DNA-binding MarR family transcriptional regulator